jgi:hypothetical protein
MVLISLLGGAQRRSSLPLCLCRVMSLPRMPFGSLLILRLRATSHATPPANLNQLLVGTKLCSRVQRIWAWGRWSNHPCWSLWKRLGDQEPQRVRGAPPPPPPPSPHTHKHNPPTYPPPTQRSRSRSSFGLRQNLCDTSYIRSKGMRFGIYGAAGQTTCASRVGSLYHERADAEFFAELGVE